MTGKSSEIRYWKSTYRLLFAILIASSVYLSERFVFPYLLNVSWQGSTWDEVLFVLLVWFLSSLIIGTTMIATIVIVVVGLCKDLEGQRLDRTNLAEKFFASSLSRWMMSLAPCIGPPISLAILSYFYRSQLPFPDMLTMFKGCALLGLISFLLCLPLTLDAQRSLGARVKEKFPGANLPEEGSGDESASD